MKLSQINKIYCINLERRPDRWALAEAQFAKYGLQVERFSAVEGSDFARQTNCTPENNGCTVSHYTLIDRAQILGLDVIMVFEDDVQLADDFLNRLETCLSALPPEWDLLYLGGSHKEPVEPFNEHLSVVFRTLTTHGYILRSTAFKKLIGSMPALHTEVDGYFAQVQKEYNCFVTEPPLAWQREDYSDIQKTTVKYDHIKNNVQ